MPDVVVDTNILVRAIIKSSGSDGKIYKEFLNFHLSLYYSQQMFIELNRVLNYPRIKNKYNLNEVKITKFLDTISIFGKLVIPIDRVTFSRDKDDNKFLSVAVSISKSSQAYLITGDRDLLVLKGKIEKVNILTPQEF